MQYDGQSGCFKGPGGTTRHKRRRQSRGAPGPRELKSVTGIQMAGTNNRRTGQGRKSAASHAVIAAGPGVERPKPPEAFTKAERAHWHRIVDAMPVDWFTPECAQLLVRLCALLVMA